MATDPLFLLLGWATTFVIALGKGAFGGGLAMLGIPMLSLMIAPLDAAIVTAALVAFMDLFALNAFGRTTWSWPDLVWLLPGLLAGIALGWSVFSLVDPRWVALLIAVITLGFTAHFFLKGRHAVAGGRPPSPPLGLLAGTTSGFTTFVAHAGGPPVAMYLLRRGLDKTLFVGTTVAFFTLGNFLKLPPYLMLGWDRPGVLLAALALAPAAPAGVWLGTRLHHRLDQKRLFLWCYAILGLAAAKMLFDAVRSLLA